MRAEIHGGWEHKRSTLRPDTLLQDRKAKDDDAVIPLEWAESAKGRQVAMSPVWPVWGCDVARFGDDRITLLKRQGNTLLAAPIIWRHLDGPQVAGRIVADYRATPHDMKPRAICVDVLNAGTSVVDSLLRDPTLSVDDVLIVAVNVAESPANDETNHRLRDELWWKGREWFQGRDVCIRIENMSSECADRRTDRRVDGADLRSDRRRKRLVISKKEMKKDLGRSPDIADGFLLTFAAPI